MTKKEALEVLAAAERVGFHRRLRYEHDARHQESHALMAETYDGGWINLMAYKPRNDELETVAKIVNLHDRLVAALHVALGVREARR